MTIEVGKTYSLRGGGYVKIESKDEWITNSSFTYFGYIKNAFSSKGEKLDRLAYFTENGRYCAKECQLDIIGEYEGTI